MILIITLITIICMLFTPTTETTTEKQIVNQECITCKDGYQYYIEYSDESFDEYFVCDSRAAEELMREFQEEN